MLLKETTEVSKTTETPVMVLDYIHIPHRRSLFVEDCIMLPKARIWSWRKHRADTYTETHRHTRTQSNFMRLSILKYINDSPEESVHGRGTLNSSAGSHWQCSGEGDTEAPDSTV